MKTFIFIDDDGSLFECEYCAVPGCKNGRSYRLNSKFCHPHTNDSQGKLMKFAIFGPKKKKVTVVGGV